jgi:RND family efflux transporter MFP subunit
MRRFTLYALMILIIFSFNCSKKKTNKIENVQDVEYKMAPIKYTEIDSPIKLLGSVAPFKKAEVSSKVLGRVEKILKEEGDRVDLKAPLAKIETLNLEIQLRKDLASLEVQNRQIQLSNAKYLQSKQRVERDYSAIEKAKADVQDAESRYLNIERVFGNKSKLHEEGAVSETELKAVETELTSAKTNYFKSKKTLENLNIGYRPEDLKRAGIAIPKDTSQMRDAYVELNTIVEKAELEIAKANLENIKASIESTNLLIKESTILSPIKGTVATRNIFPGEAVKEQQPLFAIVDDSEILIKFAVNEGDASRVKLKQKVQFTVDAFPENKFEGLIHIISPLVDPQSRTFEIKVLYFQKESKIKPGMFARGEVLTATSAKLFSIPSKSVRNIDKLDEAYIFAGSTQGILVKKPIKVAKVENDSVFFSADLKEGDLIAVGNAKNIQEGESYKTEKK